MFPKVRLASQDTAVVTRWLSRTPQAYPPLESSVQDLHRLLLIGQDVVN